MLLQGLFGNQSFSNILISIAYRLPALLIGLSFHEAAHAYAAYRAGDPTARNLGRMSLDPFRHLDLVGTLMLLFVGFGWAKPVPINPRNFKNPRKDEFMVSIAGIATNLALAFIFTGIYVLLLTNGWTDANGIVDGFIISIIGINTVLAVFNLIPVPPLDGHHLITAAFPRTERFFYSISRYNIFILIGVILVLSNTGILSFMINFVMNGFFRFFSLFI